MGRLLVALTCLLVVRSRELFPFGPQAGDRFNPQDDDSCSERVALTTPIFFYGESYSELYVCNNGVISFRKAIIDYVPEPFPLENRTVISPLWSDVDLRDPFMDYSEQHPEAKVNIDSAMYMDEYAEDALRDWIANRPSGGSDDEISRRMFTRLEKDPKLRVNLANNVFHRQTTNQTTLATIQAYLADKKVSKEPVTWAMVATWYYVGPFHKRVDAFNTFQAVLASVESIRAPEQHKLVVIFIYHSIQWTRTDSQAIHSQAGFNDGNGHYYMLPGSRLPEVRNLASTSNVNDPGVWVFVLDEDGGVTCRSSADGVLTPDASFLTGGGNFTISGLCDVKQHDSIQVRFTGARRMISVQGSLTEQGSIQGRFPYWGRSEQKVRAELLLNHRTLASFTVRFYSQLERFRFQGDEAVDASTVGIVRARRSDGSQVLAAKWDVKQMSSSADQVTMKVVKVKEKFIISKQEAELSFGVINELKVPNNGSAEIEAPSGDYDFVHVIVMSYNCSMNEFGLGFHSSSCGGVSTDPIAAYKPSERVKSCRAWLEKEESGGTRWHREVEKWYGCPRFLPKFRRARPDAWFAETEVERGFRGWQYDQCCMLNPPKYLRTLKVCENCGRNPGAEFCIQSIQLRVQDDSGSSFDSSNKCCYDPEGSLLTNVTDGAGTVGKSFDDVTPYEDCCDELSPPELCSRYHELRPPLVGEYFTSVSRILYGDPHLETLDGVKYTFNGFGVYQLLLAHDRSLDVQVSTRVKGKGTVFSGISIKRLTTRAEVFLLEDGDVRISVNGATVDPYMFSVNLVDDVMVMAKENSTEFVLIFEDGFSVKAMVKTSVLNFGLSVPPKLNGKLRGLLGNFDDDAENDFISRNGEKLPISLAESEEGTAELHESFGESWRVARGDWSFSYSAAIVIDTELERDGNYSAVYVTKFESEQVKQQAEEACSGAQDASACLLDVALTQDLALARVSREIAPDLEAADALTEVHAISEYPIETTSGSLRPGTSSVFVSALLCIVFGSMYFL